MAGVVRAPTTCGRFYGSFARQSRSWVYAYYFLPVLVRSSARRVWDVTMVQKCYRQIDWRAELLHLPNIESGFGP